MLVRLAGTLMLVAACAHSLSPRQPPPPPLDPRQRYAAEVAACRNGTLPSWLDDEALNAAIELDHREAQASVANDSFHGGTYVSQPPPLAKPGARATAIENDRRAFQFSCEASKRKTP
jgi:hypothetical protein